MQSQVGLSVRTDGFREKILHSSEALPSWGDPALGTSSPARPADFWRTDVGHPQVSELAHPEVAAHSKQRTLGYGN